MGQMNRTWGRPTLTFNVKASSNALHHVPTMRTTFRNNNSLPWQCSSWLLPPSKLSRYSIYSHDTEIRLLRAPYEPPGMVLTMTVLHVGLVRQWLPRSCTDWYLFRDGDFDEWSMHMPYRGRIHLLRLTLYYYYIIFAIRQRAACELQRWSVINTNILRKKENPRETKTKMETTSAICA